MTAVWIIWGVMFATWAFVNSRVPKYEYTELEEIDEIQQPRGG